MEKKQNIWRLSALLLALICLSGATCNEIHTRTGTWYRVRKGDSLSRIAQRYQSSVQSIAEHNNIMQPSQLQIGQRLYVPHHRSTYAKSSLPIHTSDYSKKRPIVAKANPKAATKSQTKAIKSDKNQIQVYNDKFIWPVVGQVSSGFGIRQGRRHDGLDISAPRGSPIKAADSGEVVFASRLRGYGNLILVKHKDDFFTVYAHNARNLAQKGQKIKQGEVIARVGSTGRATGPHLHFEVRKGSQARNPLFFLPQPETQMAKK